MLPSMLCNAGGYNTTEMKDASALAPAARNADASSLFPTSSSLLESATHIRRKKSANPLELAALGSSGISCIAKSAQMHKASKAGQPPAWAQALQRHDTARGKHPQLNTVAGPQVHPSLALVQGCLAAGVFIISSPNIIDVIPRPNSPTRRKHEQKQQAVLAIAIQ